jgi:hypothetical protein
VSQILDGDDVAQGKRSDTPATRTNPTGEWSAIALLKGLFGSQGPATHAALVTPDDATDLAVATRGISFATAGAIKVTTVAGETLVIPSGALAAGVMHPLEVTRIWNTGTTAASIVRYW